MSFKLFATVDRATSNGNGHAPAARPSSGYAMPWGKHKGKPIDEVPADYLEWALKNASNLNDQLRAEIEKQLGLLPGSTKTAPDEEIRVLRNELERHKAMHKVVMEEVEGLRRENRRLLQQISLVTGLGYSGARPATINVHPKVDALRAIVKGLYRRLTLANHPDRGGSAEAMRIVVDVFRTLDEEIATWEKS